MTYSPEGFDTGIPEEVVEEVEAAKTPEAVASKVAAKAAPEILPGTTGLDPDLMVVGLRSGDAQPVPFGPKFAAGVDFGASPGASVEYAAPQDAAAKARSDKITHWVLGVGIGRFDWTSEADQAKVRRYVDHIIKALGPDSELLEHGAMRNIEAAAGVTTVEAAVRRAFGGDDPWTEFIEHAFDMIEAEEIRHRTVGSILSDIEEDRRISVALDRPFDYLDTPEPGEGWDPDMGKLTAVARLVSEYRPGEPLGETVAALTDSGHLVFAAESGWEANIKLNAGTVVNTPRDALFALAEALEGTAHEIVSLPDHDPAGIPQMITGGIGALLDVAGQLIPDPRWSESSIAPDVTDEQVEEMVAQAAEQVRRGATSPEGAGAFAALMASAEQGDRSYLSAAEGSSILAAMPLAEAAEYEEMLASLVDEDEVRETVIEGLQDDRTWFRRRVDDTIEWGILKPAQWWAGLMGDLSVNAVDFFGDLGQGIADIAGISDNWSEMDEPGLTDPRTAFRNSFERHEADSVSELIGWEDSSWGAWIDFGASLAVDPITWITIGASQQRQWLTHMLSSTTGTRQVMRLPNMKKLAFETTAALKGGNDFKLAILLNGMDFADQARILRLAETGGAKLSRIVDEMVAAMPAGGKGGTWIPNVTGRLALRRSAQKAAEMARKAESGDSAAQDWFGRILGSHSRERAYSVAGGQAGNDFMDLLFWVSGFADDTLFTADDFSYWYRQVLATHDDFFALDQSAQAMSSRRVVDAARDKQAAASVRPNSVLLALEDAGRAIPGSFDDLAKEFRALVDDALSAQKRLDGIEAELRVQRAFPATPETEATIARLEAEASYIRDLGRHRGFAATDAMWAKAVDDFEGYVGAVNAAEKSREGAAKLAAKAYGGRRSRESWATLYERFENHLAETVLKLERRGDGWDWRPVTGADEARVGLVDDTLDASRFDVDPRLSEAERAEHAARMESAGIWPSHSWYKFRASPLQMAAHIAAEKGGWLQRFAAKAARPTGTIGEKMATQVQRAFASVILTGKTSIKSSLDEWIRAHHGGRHMWSGQRAASIDPATGAILESRAPGIAEGVFRQFAPQRHSGMSEGALHASREAMPSNPFEAKLVSATHGQVVRSNPATARSKLGRKVDTRYGEEVTVSRAVHRQSAYRYADGHLIENSQLNSWAQDIVLYADSEGISIAEALALHPGKDIPMVNFRRWYHEGGDLNRIVYNPLNGTVRAGDLVDEASAASQHLRLLHGASSHKDAAKADSWIDALVRRIADQERLVSGERGSEYIARGFGPVPTDLIPAGGQFNIYNMPFHMMFGNPGQNRFGIIYMDKYDQTIQILRAAHEDAGTLLTAETLAARTPGMSVEKAADLLIYNPDEAAAVARQHGMVTPRYLEVVADRIARNHASHLMYQPGATSMIGATTQQAVANFGPAYFDFLSWWQNELRKASMVGMFGKYTQIPNIFNVRGGFRHWRETGKLKGMTDALGAVPANFRLLDRIGLLGGNIINHTDEDDPAVGWDRLSVGDATKWVTFFPVTSDDPTDIMVDLGVQPSPWIGATIRLLPDITEINEESSWLAGVGATVRDTFEALNPALDFGDEDVFGGLDAWRNILFPDYPGSPLNFIRTGAQSLTDQPLGFDAPRDVQYAFNEILGGEFREDRWKPGEPVTTQDESDRFPAVIERASAEAFSRAATVAWQKSFDRLFLSGEVAPRAEQFTLPQLHAISSLAQDLLEWGYLGRGDAKDLQRFSDAQRNRTLSADDLGAWRNLAMGTYLGVQNRERAVTLYKFDGEPFERQYPLFSKLTVENPDLALMTTASYRCNYKQNGQPVNAEYCGKQGRPELPDDGTASDILERGLGASPQWFVRRDDTDRGMEAEWRVATARRELLSFVYSVVMERDRLDSKTLFDRLDDLPDTVDLSPVNLDELRGDVRDMMWAIGMFGGDITGEVTRQEFIIEVETIRNTLHRDSPWVVRATSRSELMAIPEFVDFNQRISDLEDAMEDRGLTDPEDWPADLIQGLHEFGQYLVGATPFTLQDWNDIYAPALGNLGWEPVDPPPLSELPADAKVLRLSKPGGFLGDLADPASKALGWEAIRVVDGDTLHITLGDGEILPVRLIGINAPDAPLVGAEEATADLYDLIYNEDRDIALVIWQPEVYGTEAGRDYLSEDLGPRMKMWLYADGEPTFHQESFTIGNPRGISAGLEYVPLPRPGEKPAEGRGELT